jgi:hypothetical protein
MGRTSRRDFLFSTLLTAAAAPLVGSPLLAGRLEAASQPPADLLHDTFSGLVALVVPGSDPYSVAQGVSTADAGGLDVGDLDDLIATLDESTPFVPQFSAVVASILNGLAQAVNTTAVGPFQSPFANLSFAEKVAVFQIMDATDSLKVLAGVLPAFAAFFCYSEAAAYDPATRSLTGEPLAWRLSSYSGVADGRAEFRGYFPQSLRR